MALLCCGRTDAVYSQQQYNTCEVYQFLDSDSSYIEKIAVRTFSGGLLTKEVSVADMENNDSYLFCKRLKGTKIFKGGDTTKLQEIRRFDFVTTEYFYNKQGKLQHTICLDDFEGVRSHENSMYEYGQNDKPARKYQFDVSHNLIHGVIIDCYAYDGDGRLMSDSAMDDHRLVVDYDWDEDNNRLLHMDEASMQFVPISSASNLQFRFYDEKDTMNRRMVVKQYHYFDGGYEIRSSVRYWNGIQPESYDSVFTNKNSQPVTSVTAYKNKRRVLKQYYYNNKGDLARIVIDDNAGENSGHITRMFKYLTKKTADNKRTR